jgi:hypothetical protein
MAIKNLFDDLRNALSIAQAGIKGTLKSLKKAQSDAKKLTAGIRTSKKMASPGIARKPKAKRKTMAEGRDPRSRARAVVPRKPRKQKSARKSK